MAETIYSYTTADGLDLSGKAAQIGEALTERLGGAALRDGNSEPWLIHGEDGDTAPRLATRAELVDWLSRAEGRPAREAEDALKQVEQGADSPDRD